MLQSTLARSRTLAAIALMLVAACGGNDTSRNAGADSVASTVGATAAGIDTSAKTGAQANVAGDQGAALYQRCVTCHQTNGEGVAAAFPPLAGSEWLTGNPSVPIRIVLHGMQGPVTVKNQQFNSVMLAYGTGQPMSDAEVASVLTYVRSSFGNNAPPITDAQVATERAATSSRKTPWTAADLQPLLKQ